MNYKSGWHIRTSSWICDHTSMNKADFDMTTGTYTVSNTKTSYNQGSFTDMYNYAADWMTSRAAYGSAVSGSMSTLLPLKSVMLTVTAKLL